MKWSNLQDGKCPQCSETLIEDSERARLVCPECTFKISLDKFQNITSHMAEDTFTRRPVRNGLTPEEQRQSELNEL